LVGLVLLGCTFLMGLHSTLFGPVKFAYLPQVLGERELTGGNGMVEMGTFVAILLGNIAGGLLVAIPEIGHRDVALACVLLALAGRAVAQFIPSAPATDPGLVINWNPVSETWRNLKLVHGNERVASLLLVVFSIGIGTSSLLCEVFSRRHVEIGLVPLGAVGMSVFAVDLYFASRALSASEVMRLGLFLAQSAHCVDGRQRVLPGNRNNGAASAHFPSRWIPLKKYHVSILTIQKNHALNKRKVF